MSARDFHAKANDPESRLASAAEPSCSVSLDTPSVSDGDNCTLANTVRVAEKEHIRRKNLNKLKVFETAGMRKIRGCTSTLSKWNRVDRLIVGFIRQYRDIPFDITRLAFDFYYSAHGEWLHQNLAIHIADDSQTRLNLGHDGFDATRWFFWRAYASSDEHCFILRLANVYRPEDNSDCPSTDVSFKYLGSYNNRLYLTTSRSSALKLRLLQPDLEKDEYYLQSVNKSIDEVIDQIAHAHSQFSDERDLLRSVVLELNIHLFRTVDREMYDCIIKHRQSRLTSLVTKDQEDADEEDEKIALLWWEDEEEAERYVTLLSPISQLEQSLGLTDNLSVATLFRLTQCPLRVLELDVGAKVVYRNGYEYRKWRQKATEENVCPNTSWNGLSAYSRVENALCDQILREGEDRFGRHLKSRRKRKAGKGKGKQERSNVNALQSRKRFQRKRKKYVKSITHRVYVS